MTACALIDIPCHLQNVLFGWIAFVPWWAWALAGLTLVGIVWKLAGWPGLIALAAGAGFALGRRSADDHEHVQGEDAAPSPFRPGKVRKVPPGKRVRTIFDMLGKR